MRLDGLEADRQTVGGAFAQQRQQFARSRYVGNEPPAHPQAAPVLGDLLPDTDRLGRIVLEQHRDAAHAAQSQRLRERARHHHIARLVDLAEQTGVTLDAAVGADRRARLDRDVLVWSEHASSVATKRSRHPRA